MPSAAFSHAATTSLDRRSVWTALQDADHWAGIGPLDEVWDAESSSDGSLVRYRWAATVGMKRFEGRAKTSEAVPLERMVLDLTSPEMTGSITVELGDAQGGTEVSVEMYAESAGFLSSMFWPVVRDAIARGLPSQVEEFVERIDRR